MQHGQLLLLLPLPLSLPRLVSGSGDTRGGVISHVEENILGNPLFIILFTVCSAASKENDAERLILLGESGLHRLRSTAKRVSEEKGSHFDVVPVRPSFSPFVWIFHRENAESVSG